jgi:hypothetical protein
MKRKVLPPRSAMDLTDEALAVVIGGRWTNIFRTTIARARLPTIWRGNQTNTHALPGTTRRLTRLPLAKLGTGR